MKVIAIDNSMLQTVAACSTDAVLTTLGYDAVNPTGALAVGTLFHSACQNRMHGYDDTSILSKFAVDYEDARGDWLFSEDHVGFNSNHPDREQSYNHDNLACILTQWLQRHPAHEPFPGLRCPAEWAEISFALPLDTVKVEGVKHLVVLTGQLDQLAEEGEELWVVDTKTTRKIKGWWKADFASSTQLRTYRWAAEQTTGREVQGCYINAIETSMLPTSQRTCYTHTYDDLPRDWKRLNPKKSDHCLYIECGPRLHATTEFFAVCQNPVGDASWKLDVLGQARKFAELDKFVRRGIVGATKTRTNGTFTKKCTFCSKRAWCQESARDLRFVDTQLRMRTDKREVRVGIYESEEAFADAAGDSKSVS